MCLFLITLGEPVSYPVNQVDGFELTIEKPHGLRLRDIPFAGLLLRILKKSIPSVRMVVLALSISNATLTGNGIV